MKKIGIVLLVIGALAMTASIATATTSLHRNCSQAGLVFGPPVNGIDPYAVQSPFHVSYTPAAITAVERTWPLGTPHPPANIAPCVIGGNIVTTASAHWLHWPKGVGGQIKVIRGTAIGYVTYPAGRFRCSNKALTGHSVAKVRCVGRTFAITASFVIERNPYAH